MASIQANGITIEYEVHGEGDPLLLVQGLSGQLIDWPDEFVAMLVADGFKVIRFDNRDIGLSTEFDWEPPSQVKSVARALARRPAKAGYLLSDMAADAAGLLEALDIDQAHVVGISMGGMIAQSLTIEHSAKVLSLTSIMSNTGDRKNGKIAGRLIARLIRLPKPTRENAVDRSVEIFAAISGPTFDASEYRSLAEQGVERSYREEGVARQTVAILASADRTAALGGVTAPTLVVHGMVDPLVKPSGGVATAKAVPGSRLVMYPDMGHDLPRARWPELIAEIRRNADRAAVSVD
ncbi:MAG: alpha/beta hydrolase [Actinobacteria bacterium]|nr:alpha/beta hydrolase [Actinomycetota bacterium]